MMAAHRAAIDRALDRYVPERRDSLSKAMRYSLFSGGKRLRSILLVAAGEAAGGPVRHLLPFACGLEMIHTYSLVHDDLPAMDDDDLRRGKPTSHRAFGEGTAILAGDALLTEAFRVMATSAQRSGVSPERAIGAVRIIAEAAGMRGMVGGQLADLEAEGGTVGIAGVRAIHRRKTGALFEAATVTGALVAGGSPSVVRALGRFGLSVGMALQIADDLRDAEASETVTGKTPRRDQARKKATYASVLGVTATRTALEREIRRALATLRPLSARGAVLSELARRIGAWGNEGYQDSAAAVRRAAGGRTGRTRYRAVAARRGR
jgi:geranylgeranyl diphosphate synthase type II